MICCNLLLCLPCKHDIDGWPFLSAATTKDAIAEGYRTMLVDNGCRGVCDSDMEATKETITSLNGLIINSSQVLIHRGFVLEWKLIRS